MCPGHITPTLGPWLRLGSLILARSFVPWGPGEAAVEFLVSQKSFGGARLSHAYGKGSTPTGRSRQRAPNRAGRALGHAKEPEQPQPVLWDLQDRWVCFSVATVMIDGLGMEKETGRKEQEDNACDFSKQL